MGIENVDVLFRQTVGDVLHDLRAHDVVVLFVVGEEHRAGQNGAVTDILGEQGGLFQADPVVAVVGVNQGVGVAVQLVQTVIGHGDVAFGPLGDGFGEEFGRLVVPLSGVEDVGVGQVNVEIIRVVRVSRSDRCEREDHGHDHQHCEEFFHVVAILFI